MVYCPNFVVPLVPKSKALEVPAPTPEDLKTPT